MFWLAKKYNLKDGKGNKIPIYDCDYIDWKRDWQTVHTDYGDLDYKYLNKNAVYVQGVFSGHTATIQIPVPFKTKRTQTFLIAGGGLNYTKAYINPGQTKIGIVVGNGNSNTEYVLNGIIVLD